jgi:hypothetical protein
MLIYNSSNVSSSALASKNLCIQIIKHKKKAVIICGSAKGRSGCLLDVRQVESVGCNTLGTVSWSRHAEDTASAFCSWHTMLMIRCGAGISSTLIPKL